MKQIIILLILVLLSSIVNANLTLEKTINSPLSVGDSAIVTLIITNNFDDAVSVKIQDENIFGNNGIIVKCFEQTVQPNKKIEIALDPISIYKSGDYTLGKATASYTINGKTQTSESNNMDVTINGQDSNGNTEGITEIYRCDGVSSTSTRLSTTGGSSMSFSFGGNSGNVKTPIVEQEQGQKSKILETIKLSEDFRKAEEKLNSDGYILQDFNTDGQEFAFLFSNGKKEKIVSGTIENDTVVNINTKSRYGLIRFILWIVIILSIMGITKLIYYFKYEPLPKHFEEPIIVSKEKPKEIEIEPKTFQELLHETRKIKRNNSNSNIKIIKQIIDNCNEAIYAKTESKEKLNETIKLFNKIK